MICSIINADTFLEKDLDLSSAIQHFTLFVVLTCTTIIKVIAMTYNQQMANTIDDLEPYITLISF